MFANIMELTLKLLRFCTVYGVCFRRGVEYAKVYPFALMCNCCLIFAVALRERTFRQIEMNTSPPLGVSCVIGLSTKPKVIPSVVRAIVIYMIYLVRRVFSCLHFPDDMVRVAMSNSGNMDTLMRTVPARSVFVYSSGSSARICAVPGIADPLFFKVVGWSYLPAEITCRRIIGQTLAQVFLRWKRVWFHRDNYSTTSYYRQAQAS